jgi:hypothetical protein
LHLLFSSQINLAGDSGGDKGGAAFFEQGDTLFRLLIRASMRAVQAVEVLVFAPSSGSEGYNSIEPTCFQFQRLPFLSIA